MIKNFFIILSATILIFSTIYVWHKLLNKKIDFKNIRFYITLLCLVAATILNYYIVNKIIRIITITTLFIFFIKYLLNEKLRKCIITPIFSQVMMSLAELISVLILMLIMGSKTEIFIDSIFGAVVINVFVSLISILIVNINFIRKLYNKIIKMTKRIGINQLIILCLILILFLNIFLISAYYKMNFKYWIFANIFLISVLLIIIVYSLKTQERFNKVSDKYNVAIKSLNDYEDMMTKYRIANHENKNLLLTIRAMILNKDEEIPKYIDTIIEDKFEDDEKLLFKINVIPSGGLRGTIYSGILKIKEKKILYNLNIDKNLRTVDLLDLDTDTIINICKIIGVFIDNAIEAVEKLRKKIVNIELNLNYDKLEIRISNNYKGTIEINKIYDDGYTTKGSGHGHGLSLVKQIVDSSKKLNVFSEIKKELFTQILEISIK